MDLTVLNKICWTLCIISIVAGTALSFSMIWVTHDSEFLWKAWLSIAVLFFASIATLVVSRVMGGKGWHATNPQ
jgi:uncharacterized membrane protein YhaH (DUF805 family)